MFFFLSLYVIIQYGIRLDISSFILSFSLFLIFLTLVLSSPPLFIDLQKITHSSVFFLHLINGEKSLLRILHKPFKSLLHPFKWKPINHPRYIVSWQATTTFWREPWMSTLPPITNFGSSMLPSLYHLSAMHFMIRGFAATIWYFLDFNDPFQKNIVQFILWIIILNWYERIWKINFLKVISSRFQTFKMIFDIGRLAMHIDEEVAHQKAF